MTQVIFFQLLFYILGAVKGSYSLSIRHLVTRFVPQNWFVILYVVLWVVSPYLNIIIDRMGDKLLGLVVCLFVLFSIYPTAVDLLAELTSVNTTGLSSIGMYGSELGYTIVNFILMYFIGAYLKVAKTKMGIASNLTILLLCESLICLCGYFEWNRNIMIEAVAWEYCNPLVILSAALTFIFFKNCLNFSNKYINLLARASFTCYLIHAMFYKCINIPKYVEAGVFPMLLHIILTAIVVYACSFAAWTVYNFVSRPVIALLRQLPIWINLETFLYPQDRLSKETS